MVKNHTAAEARRRKHRPNRAMVRKIALRKHLRVAGSIAGS
jgi:hypothetical protein